MFADQMKNAKDEDFDNLKDQYQVQYKYLYHVERKYKHEQFYASRT